jgi:hypothetical protein
VGADGTLFALGRNPDIYKLKDNCGNYADNGLQTPTSIGSAALWEDTYTEHYQNGQYIGAWYGAGGKSIAGDFKVNYALGQIELGISASNVKYVLEYISSSPQRINGQYLVHPFLVEPLLAWIRYAKKRNFVGIMEVKALEADYIAKKQWAAQRFWNMDYDQILEIMRKHMTQSPNF